MSFSSKCQICVTDKSLCDECKDNPKYKDIPRRSLFMVYKPTCPFGMNDCIGDPAYCKFYHPKYYEKWYGDLSPEEVIKESCSSCIEWGYPKYYDDEDK